MNKILSASINEVSQRICTGDVRPSNLSKAAVKITSMIKPLNAFITVTKEEAKKHSEDADLRQKNQALLSKLDGVPIAIKDNYCTKGQLTTCASRMLSNFVPTYNATVYQRLKDSGAVLIGKTNLDEFAMGSGTVNSYYGPTKNLWGSDILNKYYSCRRNLEGSQLVDQNSWYIAGGSSGGSAIAVASGCCYAALGSDTGGSVRNPASYCGLVGLKPTYGLVSRYGLIPLVNSMDAPGIFGRNVEDVLLILNIIAGPDTADSSTIQKKYDPINLLQTVNVNNFKIGIPREYKISGICPEMQSCWDEVSRILEEAGATVVPVSLPHTGYSIVCYSVLNRCDVASNFACYDGIEYGFRANEWCSTHDLFRKTRSEGFSDVVKERILIGNYFLLAENYNDYYVKAMKMRRLILQDFEKVWDNVDFLLTPTTLTEAPNYKEFILLDNQTQCLIQDYCTQPANMAGIPAINLPIKLSTRGLPLSLQIMAPPFHEKNLFTLSKWIENTQNFPKLELKDTCTLK